MLLIFSEWEKNLTSVLLNQIKDFADDLTHSSVYRLKKIIFFSTNKKFSCFVYERKKIHII